ncbi:MAG: glycosyltransferase family 8 protein [Velocimicrobium sp.]
MNVAYHSSNSFAPVLGTSIASLFENNKGMNEIHVYVIEEKISKENKDKLNILEEKYNRNIHFIPMPDINKTQNLGLKKVRKDWIFNSYCRLFLDQILPKDLHRVLYLDSDVLITGDLTELWNTDITGHCAAGVIDCLGEKYYKLLGLNSKAKYCNSGVILQNLDLWRISNIGNRIRNYVHKNGGYVFFMEQSVYNAVFQEEILILSPKYNTYTLMQYLSYQEIMKLRNPKRFYKEKEIKEAVKDHKIVHLTNIFLITNRAWFEYTNHPEKKEFIYYKNMTPWKDEPGFSDTRTTKKKLIQFCVELLPRPFVIASVGMVYNSFRILNIKRLMKKYRKTRSVD